MPRFLRKIKKRVNRRYQDINPEDIFLDSTNLPGFIGDRLEGRIEKPVETHTFLFLKAVFVIIVFVLGVKLSSLQIVKGAKYSDISENNKLEHTTIFANRGVIYDRNHLELAYNSIKGESEDYAHRVYADIHGLSHVLGYIKYPSKDSNGNYYDENYKPMAGVEKVYNDVLLGKNGIKLTETDALGKITSESVVNEPQDSKPLVLTIDAKVNQALYDAIKETADTFGYTGGAGVIMNVETGEILALTSYPDYDSNIMTAGTDKNTIKAYLTDNRKVFLDRAVSGLYTPGSIVKPVVALAALNEGVISPDKKILSTGSISIPNPYDPSKPSIFKDWKAHGWVDMRSAIAVSSDVYFYEVGGGYPGQKGVGIDNLEKYFKLFGMTEETGIDLMGENSGTIPSPEWKAKNFDGDPWRLGDTYNTSIGQYGMQVTPLEAVRFIAAVANSGKLLVPILVSKEPQYRSIELNLADWQIVREVMRLGVTGPNGTSHNLSIPGVEVAGKTGTAQVGAGNKYINSWSVGFFPYSHPRYAYTVIMEKGPATNTVGAIYPMRKLLDWMSIYSPEYFD
jgi:penicillin-binding protein 2